MAKVVIDKDTFWSHLNKIFSEWQAHRASSDWGSSDSLAVAVPKYGNDSPLYSKTTSLTKYLFGYELTSIVLVMTRTHFHVLAGTKKIDLFEPLNEDPPSSPLQLKLHRISKEDGNMASFEEMIADIKSSHKGDIVGTLLREFEANSGVDGNVAKSFQENLESAGLKRIEISAGVATVFAEKDEGEALLATKASRVSYRVMRDVFIAEMEKQFDDEEAEKRKHSGIATDIEETIEQPEKLKKLNINVPVGTASSCYYPIVQSGGNEAGFNIKPSATSDDGQLSEDIVICSLGVSFKNYCANIARTFFIDPIPKVQQTYKALTLLRAECLSVMQAGGALVDVYATAKKFLKTNHPDLVKHLPKNIGFSLGLEFKDSTYAFSAKTDPSLKFKPNMIFNLAVGFQDVPLTEEDRAKAKGSVKKLDKFSLLIADTVKIPESGKVAEVLTEKPSVEWQHVSYNIKNENESDSGEEESDDEDGVRVKTAAGVATVLSRRLRERTENTDEVTNARQKRMEKQLQLHEKKIERGKKGLGEGFGLTGDDEEKEIVADDFESFPTSEKYPPDASSNMIHVDMDREVVFLPINGQPVPFHISTIRNVVLPDPDRSTYLRLNFYTPGQAVGKDAPKQIAAIVEKHKQGTDCAFIKEFTFRSVESRGLSQAYRLIQELRKRTRQREAQKAQQADLIVQAKLIRTRDGRVPRLADLEMRPALTGRKSKGNLEAHTNGLRFSDLKKGEHVDIMYGNVKHALFQPCQNEHIIVVHFHLVNPIMIGKKKTSDVQFITEVVEASEDVNARNSMYDPDELELEQRERKMRKALNLKFKEFVVKVEDVAKRHDFKLEFEMPYRDLAFHGTPHREMVTLLPSVNCLVNLTETPAFVLSMREVEHVHFERCVVGNKNFDMVFILRDLNQQTPTKMISAVDMREIDEIQEWLTNQDITYTVGTINIDWKGMVKIIKDLVEDGVFWEEEVDEKGETLRDAGWMFLNAGSASDDEDEDDESEQEYQAESAEEESEDYEDEDDESEFEDEDDESEFDEEEEEEAEGMDWDELEAEAKASDKRSGEWEEEEKPAKKSRRKK